MPDQTKIATCCYCGRRQALRMTARGGRELACGSCGAPLHEMKWLKPPVADHHKKRSPRAPAPHGGPVHREGHDRPALEDPRRRKPVKRHKPMWKKALGEVFDVIEDIFD